ncbi:hypothetical protein Glove_406g113 [Diversispora epigaea]|uniref:HMG box domain-containing protein n=1 Tax=Diversispora epigaea TaxID=1348612 RepID=A0A397H064_9GLOM|nr:hypothetical protein Glove_406g113 [Diversispora epigaea]
MPKVTKSNNSGSIETPTRKISDPPPELTLPFPPEISPEELIANTRKLPSKPPNAFFIYRKVYTKALVNKNMRFKMTDVSPWVSSSWKLEPEEVKTKYKEIARNVRQIYKRTKESSSVPPSNYDCKETQIQTQTQTQTQTNSSSSSPEQTESPIEKLLTPDLSQEDNIFGQWTNTDFHSPQEELNFEFPDLNFSPTFGSDSSNNDNLSGFNTNLNVYSSFYDFYPQVSMNNQLPTTWTSYDGFDVYFDVPNNFNFI